MRRPVLFLLIGALFYSGAYSLKKYQFAANAVTLMFCYSSVILVLSSVLKIVGLKNGTPWFEQSSNSDIAWMIVFGLMFALGDFFFFEGSDAPEVTSAMTTAIFAIIPIFSVIIEIFVEKKPLNMRQLIACGLIIAGVVLFAYSEDPAK